MDDYYQSPPPPNIALFQAIVDWAHHNADQISEMWQVRGGWEGWVQEELRDLFNAGREDNCYVNNEDAAADLLLMPGLSGYNAFAVPYVEEECVVIELKCESAFSSHRFKERVAADIRKISEGVFKMRLLRGGCNVYCIAMSTTEDGRDAMIDLGMELFELEGWETPFELWWCVRQIGAEEFVPGGEDEFYDEYDDF